MASSTADNFTFKYVDAAETIAIGTTLSIVCIAIVALRVYTRTQQSMPLGIDDYLVVGGLFCFIGMAISLVYGAAVGAMGYPTPLPPANASEEAQLQFNPQSTVLISKLQFAFQLFMVICYGLVKMSIVYFYRRIFVGHKHTTFDIMTHVVNLILFLWSLTFVLMVIFDCGSHIFANWGSAADQEAYCAAIGHTMEEGLAGSDLVLDVILIILPLPSIWALHMKTTRKLQVTFIMVLGLSAIAASIARLVLYVQIIQAALAMQPVDSNQVLTLGMYWSTLEVGLAIIAACLPSLSALVTTRSIRSAVRSVRSVLSLHSDHGSKIGIRGATDGYNDLERPSSSSHHIESGKSGSETYRSEYEMGPFEASKKRTHVQSP